MQTSMVEPPFLIQREDTARSVSSCGNGSNGNGGSGSRTHSLINLRYSLNPVWNIQRLTKYYPIISVFILITQNGIK